MKLFGFYKLSLKDRVLKKLRFFFCRVYMVVTRAVAVTKFCQPVIVKQINVGLTVIDR